MISHRDRAPDDDRCRDNDSDRRVGKDAGAVPKLEDQLRLGMSHDAVNGDVVEHEVSERLCGFGRGATERRRQIGLLTTLGLPVRRAGRILGWEVLPSALVSIVVGTMLGLGLPAIVLDRVDLAAFAGGATAPDTHQPAWLVPVAAGGVLLLVVVEASTSAFLTRRADLTDVLRMGED